MRLVIGKIRDGADKLFLLALFTLGLAIAQGLVVWYQRVRLSEPVPLGQTGLAVPLPVGPGWTSPGVWGIGSRGFMLVANLRHPSAQAEMQCLYRPSDEIIVSRARLSEVLQRDGLQVADSGRLRLGRAELHWVQAEGSGSPGQTVFLGVMSLDRAWVELRVKSLDADLARRVFIAVCEKIRYRPPPDPRLSV